MPTSSAACSCAPAPAAFRQDAVAQPERPVVEPLDALQLQPHHVAGPSVGGLHQPAGTLAAHQARLDDEADLVHETGTQQRPDEMAAGVDTDRAHTEAGGQPFERRRQVHALVAGDDRLHAVGGEGLEMRGRRGRRAKRDHIAPVGLAAQLPQPRQPAA